MARFDEGGLCSMHLRRCLAWTVWCLIEWSDLSKGEYGMRQGTRAVLSSGPPFVALSFFFAESLLFFAEPFCLLFTSLGFLFTSLCWLKLFPQRFNF